jgi:hypothetical protein
MCIIKQLTLDTTNYVFQLAYLRTPSGGVQARDEALHIQIREAATDGSDNDPLTYVGFMNETDQESATSDEDGILGDDFAHDGLSFAPLGAPPASAHGRRLEDAPEDPSDWDEPDRQDAWDTEGNDSKEEDLPSIDPAQRPDHILCAQADADPILCAQADADPMEIEAQWGIDDDLASETRGTFQGSLMSSPTELRMQPIPEKDLCPWGFQSGSGHNWGFLRISP